MTLCRRVSVAWWGSGRVSFLVMSFLLVFRVRFLLDLEREGSAG